MNKLFKLTTVVLMVATAISFSACKKNFDNPPGAADPAIVANTTIQTLKAMHTSAGAYDVITSDIIISGVVVADDKSGNFYKQLYIQDATGGLQILLDANSLYGSYPVGRKIFIKCKGLCISDYNKTMELGIKATVSGLPSIEGIPSNLISNYVIGGSLNNPVIATPVTLAQLGGTSNTNMQDPYIGMLVQLDNFAFNNINATYSDTSAYKATQNLDLKNCSGDAIIIRTSAYANFAGQQVAQGRGKLTAIYTVFGNTKQFIIRDQSDVDFPNPYACPLPPGTLFFEDFESIGANNGLLNITGWKNIGEVGGISYQNAVFGPIKCAKISAFNTGASTVTSWFISPSINLTGATAPKLTFLETAGFAVGSTVLEVLVSTNYNGSNTPSTSSWTQVWSRTATTPTSGFGTLASVGNINLSAFIGQNVFIAFKYSGGDPTKTTTYEIDDVKVLAQ
ncbi:MAG TPA: DUF5689 domain-containing protein [Ferruginibacter sp.]|nr:DUF5689 domain-containing protein [Ferruginibacter sp.]